MVWLIVLVCCVPWLIQLLAKVLYVTAPYWYTEGMSNSQS